MRATSTGQSRCKLAVGISGAWWEHTSKDCGRRASAKQKRGQAVKSWSYDSGKSAYSSQRLPTKKSRGCCPTCGQVLPKEIHLSMRERQVVDLVGAQGMTYAQAAKEMGIEQPTVAGYAQVIRDRVGTGKPRVVLALVAQQQEARG